MTRRISLILAALAALLVSWSTTPANATWTADPVGDTIVDGVDVIGIAATSVDGSGVTTFQVYCDLAAGAGGWTLAGWHGSLELNTDADNSTGEQSSPDLLGLTNTGLGIEWYISLEVLDPEETDTGWTGTADAYNPTTNESWVVDTTVELDGPYGHVVTFGVGTEIIDPAESVQGVLFTATSAFDPVDVVPDDGYFTVDNCPDGDEDRDGICDADDNCPSDFNPLGGNICEPEEPDRDGDGIPDSVDNCPDRSNSAQVDSDGDGRGDSCQAVDEHIQQNACTSFVPLFSPGPTALLAALLLVVVGLVRRHD